MNDTQTAHTPGPWTACNGASVSIEDSVEVIPDHVRRVFWDELGRRCTQFIATCNELVPESAANARLIAASPEMYEVLKAIVTISGFHHLTGENLDKARAAIQKAEGAR